MAYKCENCHKGVMYGHNVSHSKRRTGRVFKPNLHYARVLVDGRYKRRRLCAECVRMIKKKEKAQAVQAASSQPVGTHL